MPQRDTSNSLPPFDPARRYVRLTRVRTDGFVEFEFAIGDPDLAVDLILPADAYRDFCRDNDAVLVSPLQGAAIDRARVRWSTGDQGEQGDASAPFRPLPEETTMSVEIKTTAVAPVRPVAPPASDA